eukprot:maker-scaffold363_size195477-snap-gene-0.50 protein:Tk06662 transcript:maker-scaffold363_size195477-snap-gene-0.50-mRNA-1 annotation:"transient receptor potential channel pyrexia-like"
MLPEYQETFSNRIQDVNQVDIIMPKLADLKSSSMEELNTKDWENILKNNNHGQIISKLKNTSLGAKIPGLGQDKDKSHTLFYTVLKKATNGDKILLEVLDNTVSATADDENDPDYALQVEFGPLLAGSGDANQIDVVKDLLEFKNSPAKEVLKHPVLETFLDLKWRKIKKFVMVNFALYLIFLIFYSWFLANVFYRQDRPRALQFSDLTVQNDRIVFPSDLYLTTIDKSTKNKSHHDRSFLHCLSGTSEGFNWTCLIEIVLIVTIFLLLAQEIMQFYALGWRQYLRELENILEVTVLILALIGLGVQSNMGALKWVSAFGITLGYLQLIFLMGRYPFLGGSISLMFYSIIRRLARSLTNFLVLVIGFAFGFFIMFHDKEGDLFENPLKAFVRTLTMVLGEFEFGPIYDAHVGDRYSLVFTMLLLVGVAIMGSLVLVNLIIALIVSDIYELREQARLQELVNKAQHVVHIDSLFDYVFGCCNKIRATTWVPNQVLLCAHNLCHCSARKVRSQITDDLIRIVKKRSILAEIESMTTGPSEERYVAEMTSAMMKLS